MEKHRRGVAAYGGNMGNFRKKFKSSFRARMMLYFYVLTLIPVLFTSVILYSTALKSVMSMAETSSRQIVDSAAAELNELMHNMASLPSIIRSDVAFQQMLRKEYSDESERVTDCSKGTATLVTLNRYQPDIYGIYVLMDNGAAMKSRYFDLRNEDFRSMALYRYVRNAEQQIWLTPEQGSAIAETVGDPVIACGTPMRDIISGESRGIIMVEVRKFRIQKILSMDIGKGGELFLMNDRLEPVALIRQSTQEDSLMQRIHSLQPEQLASDGQTLRVSGGVLIYRRLSANGWYVAGFIPQSALRAKGNVITVTVILLTLLSWLSIGAAARRISNYELEPIYRLLKTIRRIEQQDDLHARCEVVREDEIGNLTASFNQMTGHVLRLNESILQEQERLRDAEFRALQAQIKPHFLYNTLDSIAWLSRRHENQKVVEMVMALTDFFRIALSRGADIISVKEEVAHVQSYLKIQKIRYDSLFDYDFYIESGAERYAIPKLVLQPIVENALYHGVKPSGRKCRICVNVLEQDDYLLLEVIDNGAGIAPEDVARLEAALAQRTGMRDKCFGIVNVNERIRSFSGDRFGLSVSSAPGIGTLVSIRLVKRLDGDLDVIHKK